MQKKMIIASIALLLAILVGYWASTTLTSDTQKKEVVVSKETTSSTSTTSTEQIKPVQGMTKGLVFRIVLYLGLLIVGILVWEKYGLGVHWKAYWLNNPFMQAIVYAAMLNFVIYKFFPDFWWENLCSWSAVLFYCMIALSLTAGGKIGKIIAVLLLLTFIVHIGGWDLEDKVKEARASWGSSAQASTTTKTPGQSVYVQQTSTSTPITLPPLTAATFNMEENPCLERVGWKGQDVKRIKEALVDYPALLAVACRESGLNHMDPKKPNQVLLGKSDSRDQGFLQINSFYHPPETVEKEVGCKDLKEFTCSEKYGKKIYDKYGLNPWYPYGTRNESGRTYKPLTVPVIAGAEFGPRINIPRLTNETRFDHPGHQVVVEAEAPDGSKKEYTLTHGQYTGMGHVVWLRIKRGPDETGNVGLKITYIFQQSPIVN